MRAPPFAGGYFFGRNVVEIVVQDGGTFSGQRRRAEALFLPQRFAVVGIWTGAPQRVRESRLILGRNDN